MSDNKAGVLNADEIGKSVEELVSLGCKFVVTGEIFQAMIQLIEKLLVDGAADKAGEAFLVQLRIGLLQTSKPVKEKLSEHSDLIIVPGRNTH